MAPEDNLIKPSQPAGPQPPSYDLPITIGHQAVMNKPVIPDNDGATSIPVTVNRSFRPAPAPTSITEPDITEPPTPMSARPVPAVSAQPHPQQAKIDAHPLFQKEGYNPQPPEAGQGLSPAAGAPLPKRRRGRKLLWLVLALLVLLVSYAAVDALTDIKLPYEFFKKADTVPAAQSPSATQDATFQLPVGWVWYENKVVGFKFAYPEEWPPLDKQEVTFISFFDSTYKDDPSKNYFSVELRLDQKDVSHENSDSAYTKGFYKQGEKYYQRIQGDTNGTLIETTNILAIVPSALGEVLVVKGTSISGGLDLYANLPHKDYPGLTLTLINEPQTSSGRSENSADDYTDQDIEVLKKVAASFSSL